VGLVAPRWRELALHAVHRLAPEAAGGIVGPHLHRLFAQSHVVPRERARLGLPAAVVGADALALARQVALAVLFLGWFAGWSDVLDLGS
jgi:hypothetical protein